MKKAYYASPIGILEISATEQGISAIQFIEQATETTECDDPLLNNCILQLNEYFNKKRKVFDIALDAAGTKFQQSVWVELQKIPFGKVASYGDIAKNLGDINKVRAVGKANGSNPIPIIVPCHRIIGVNGKLIGYAGGLWRKQWLLEHENALLI